MFNFLKSCLRRSPKLRAILQVLKGNDCISVPYGYHVALLDYPVQAKPRYGFGKPRHAKLAQIINRNRRVYEETLRSFIPLADELGSIPSEAAGKNDEDPHWNNGFLPDLDAIAIYAFLALGHAGLYMEIGSGNSTTFARKAIKAHGRSTRIVSIDPTPRASIDALCDELVRVPVEDVALSVFDRLEEGDILFFDGSHRCFMNSDVTVFFLDILPRLKAGVVVGIHDIMLPDDYWPEWASRFYSEQYLLAAYLLAEGSTIEPILPAWFVSQDDELVKALTPLYSVGSLVGRRPHGGAFWFRILPPG